MTRIYFLLLILVGCLFLLFLSLGVIANIEFAGPKITVEQTYSLLKTVGLGLAVAVVAIVMTLLYKHIEQPKKDNGDNKQ